MHVHRQCIDSNTSSTQPKAHTITAVGTDSVSLDIPTVMTSPLETLTPVDSEGLETTKSVQLLRCHCRQRFLRTEDYLDKTPAGLNLMDIHRAIFSNHKPKEAPLTGLPLRSVPLAEFKSFSITEVPEISSLACQRLTSTSSNTSWLLSGLRPIATDSCR